MELLKEDWSDIDLSEDNGENAVVEDCMQIAGIFSYVVGEEVNEDKQIDGEDVE